MKHQHYIVYIISLLAIISFTSAFGQNNYEIKEGSTLQVNGTSSLHAWSMEQETFSGSIKIAQTSNTLVLQEGIITCKAEELKSESSIMNNKAYDALKTEKHPIITFRLTTAQTLHFAKDATTSTLDGTLTIAGVSKKSTLIYSAKRLEDNSISLTGTTNIKMSDFNISPPTAMFGTIKTGDEIEIKYDVILLQKQVLTTN